MEELLEVVDNPAEGELQEVGLLRVHQQAETLHEEVLLAVTQVGHRLQEETRAVDHPVETARRIITIMEVLQHLHKQQVVARHRHQIIQIQRQQTPRPHKIRTYKLQML